jgi:hypothetical protein
MRTLALVGFVYFLLRVESFQVPTGRTTVRHHPTSRRPIFGSSSLGDSEIKSENIYETLALGIANLPPNPSRDQLQEFVQYISLLRVGIPTFGLAASAKISYPFVALTLAAAIDDSGVFAVVAQDASQFIQNILTTSGLVFSLLVGQTYYFMVRLILFRRI